MKKTKIENDFQLEVTRERLADMQDWLASILTQESEWRALQEPGVRDWIDKLQGEIDEYLAVYGDPATRTPREAVPAAVAVG
jgi:hypothetical protein